MPFTFSETHVVPFLYHFHSSDTSVPTIYMHTLHLLTNFKFKSQKSNVSPHVYIFILVVFVVFQLLPILCSSRQNRRHLIVQTITNGGPTVESKIHCCLINEPLLPCGLRQWNFRLLAGCPWLCAHYTHPSVTDTLEPEHRTKASPLVMFTQLNTNLKVNLSHTSFKTNFILSSSYNFDTCPFSLSCPHLSNPTFPFPHSPAFMMSHQSIFFLI